MRICVISTDYPSPGRPQNVFVEQLVNKFLKQGVNVTVIAPQSITHAIIHKTAILPRKNEVVSPDGVSYEVFRPFRITFGDNHPVLTRFFDYFIRWSVEKLINRICPDVLYAHFWSSSLLVSEYARAKSLPLFVACGEGDNAIENMIANLGQVGVKRLSESVTGVISVSSENKRKCLAYRLCREDNVIVLPNCVDTDIFRVKPSLSLRTELGIDDKDFVVAFCGDFTQRKGSRRVSEAITLLNDASIKSIFVGKPYDGEDESPDCDGTVFVGRVEHEDLPKYLNSADLFVLPTRKEGCCNAIVEALACGLPVVSSVGPFNDDILNENNSIRVNPDDVNEIARAIKTIKDDDIMRKRMKSYLAGNSTACSLEKRADSILGFIRKFAGRG